MGVNDTEKRILALAEECIRLGISRTTLWRYLSRKEGGEGES